MNPESAIGVAWIAWFVSWLAAAAWSNRTVKRATVHRELPYRFTVIIGIILLFGIYQHELSSEFALWQTGTALGWATVTTLINRRE